jgi:sulfate transport system ATP-binding protein
MAGLEVPEAGSLHFDGADALALPPNQRGVGFVFQHYALFKHMNVADNIAFGLSIRPRAQRPDKAVIAAKVDELLELVQLPGLGRRYPQQLSGGQRQRVALARALAIEPRLLLLDEPFGALDTQVRTELRLWLKGLHRRLSVTSVFVTHDQEEAMELADRIVVMRAGKIEQVGTPAEVYAAPASPFVYGFLGQANQIDCMIYDGFALNAGIVLHENLELPDGPATAWFRPHQIDFVPEGPALDGDLIDLTVIGARVKGTLKYQDKLITVELTEKSDLAVGPCKWRPREVRIYPGV